MATTTADDPWLRELLLRGDWHPDGDGAEGTVASMSRALFPAGEPPLPEAVHVNGERMDLRYAVGS